MISNIAYIVAIAVAALIVVLIMYALVLYVMAGERTQAAWRRYRITVAIEEWHVRKAHAHS